MATSSHRRNKYAPELTRTCSIFCLAKRKSASRQGIQLCYSGEKSYDRTLLFLCLLHIFLSTEPSKRQARAGGNPKSWWSHPFEISSKQKLLKKFDYWDIEHAFLRHPWAREYELYQRTLWESISWNNYDHVSQKQRTNSLASRDVSKTFQEDFIKRGRTKKGSSWLTQKLNALSVIRSTFQCLLVGESPLNQRKHDSLKKRKQTTSKQTKGICNKPKLQ